MAQNTINANGQILRDARSRYRTARREEGGAHGAYEGETRRAGGAPRAEVTVRREPTPAAAAAHFGDSVAEVVVRERRMYNGERVVQLADTWVPLDVAEAAGIEQVDTGVGGIISRMAEAGFAQTEVTEDVTQRPATPAEADALGVDPGSPVLEITHVGYTDAGRAVEVTRHTLGPGWTLRYSVPLD
ncbi:UTRA domain-containing protein [Streptomyces sp. NPDC008343]|uniref:UTRA domain-containing protein n=1 Tax=Streptomyces sp. NPDC008343 TaxID=3364828 RepID=UPI0036E72EC3